MSKFKFLRKGVLNAWVLLFGSGVLIYAMTFLTIPACYRLGQKVGHFSGASIRAATVVGKSYSDDPFGFRFLDLRIDNLPASPSYHLEVSSASMTAAVLGEQLHVAVVPGDRSVYLPGKGHAPEGLRFVVFFFLELFLFLIIWRYKETIEEWTLRLIKSPRTIAEPLISFSRAPAREFDWGHEGALTIGVTCVVVIGILTLIESKYVPLVLGVIGIYIIALIRYPLLIFLLKPVVYLFMLGVPAFYTFLILRCCVILLWSIHGISLLDSQIFWETGILFLCLLAHPPILVGLAYFYRNFYQYNTKNP